MNKKIKKTIIKSKRKRIRKNKSKRIKQRGKGQVQSKLSRKIMTQDTEQMTEQMSEFAYLEAIDTAMFDLKQLFNLNPGQSKTFLNYTFRFLEIGEKWPSTIMKDATKIAFSSNFQEPCRWKISESYFKKSVEKSKYIIIVTCEAQPGSYVEKGVVGFILANDVKDNGIYIGLICASEISSNKYYEELDATIPKIAKDDIDRRLKNKERRLQIENTSRFNFRLGLILQIMMLSHAFRNGKIHAYNHASNPGLVPVYKKTGWNLSNISCEDSDIIEDEFKKLKNKKDILNYLEGVEKTDDGYAMRLCNYNIGYLQKYTLIKVEEKLRRYNFIKYNDLCFFA